MAIMSSPGYRAAGIGVVSAALIVCAFSLGVSRGGAANGSGPSGGTAAQAATARPASGRITVTGTGTVTGTPNQLVLSLSIQISGGSVTSAMAQADHVVRVVTAALRHRGVAGRDIQTSDFSITPNYQANSEIPVSYAVSESLTATMNNLREAGGQIEAAVRAGGNAVSVNDVSLNLTDTGSLLAAARASAVRDARAKASQYATALHEPLGAVISISPEQESTPVLQFNGVAEPQASKAASGSVPIAPGSQQVSVSITVVYAV